MSGGYFSLRSDETHGVARWDNNYSREGRYG